jgi:hypothetical protein
MEPEQKMNQQSRIQTLNKEDNLEALRDKATAGNSEVNI